MAFVLSAFIPALTYYPAFALAGTFVKPSAFLPQGITNQIMVWAIINALITLIMGFTVVVSIVVGGCDDARREDHEDDDQRQQPPGDFRHRALFERAVHELCTSKSAIISSARSIAE